MKITKAPWLTTLVLSICLITSLGAIEKTPEAFNKSKIDEKIKVQIPKNAKIQLSTGKIVPLSYFFKEKKPIILNYVYYQCPMLCHLLMDGLNNTLEGLPENIKKKFTILSISFDPKDNYEVASSFQKKYSKNNKKNKNWNFAVADEETIKTLTEITGFNYSKVKNSDDFSHSSALIILTPDGKVSRYLYGIMFKAFDLKMAILEASNSKYISTLEQGLLFCYNYNPDENSYALEAMRVMQIAAALTTIVIALSILILIRNEKKRNG